MRNKIDSQTTRRNFDENIYYTRRLLRDNTRIKFEGQEFYN